MPNAVPIENGIELPEDNFVERAVPNVVVAPWPTSAAMVMQSELETSIADKPTNLESHHAHGEPFNRFIPGADQDETDLFFAAMAQCVKKLPPGERAKLRIQIGSIVGSAEIEYYKKHTNKGEAAESSTPVSCSSFSSRSYEDLCAEAQQDDVERSNDTIVYLPWSDNN